MIKPYRLTREEFESLKPSDYVGIEEIEWGGWYSGTDEKYEQGYLIVELDEWGCVINAYKKPNER